MAGWSKTRKIILVVVLLIAVIVAGGCYWAKKQVNDLVSDAENVPRQSVEQAIDKWFKLPTGSANTTGEANPEAQGSGEDLNSSGGEELNGSGSEGNSGSTEGSGHNQSSPSPVLTAVEAQKYEQISNKYKSKLIALNGEYEGRISGLLSSAQAEFNSQKSSGSQSGAIALAKKYTSAAKVLEGECDKKVYAVINQMEGELKGNNLPTAVVGQVRAGYEVTKNERRKFYMGKALKYL